GEVEQADCVHLDERADDLEHVAAGAEIPALAGDDEGLHALVAGGGAKDVADLGVALEGERVLPVGPVQRQGRDLAVDRETQVLRLVIGKRQRDRIRAHGASPSTAWRAEALVLASNVISVSISAGSSPEKISAIQFSCVRAIARKARRP